jgi:DNA polymerase III alpha subunit (gram-positive type)
VNENLLRFRDDVKFCTFDFETENLNLYSTKPWQFACVLATTKQTIERVNILINWPNLNISKDAERITRADKFQIAREGLSPKEAIDRIHKVFSKADYYVGHNILNFDIPVYRSFCREVGEKPFPIHNKAFDTMSLLKGLPERLDIPYDGKSSILEYQKKLSNKIVRKKGFASLGGGCKLMEVEYDSNQAHDALYDVVVNFNLFKKLLWKVNL